MARGVSSRLERSNCRCSRPPPDLPYMAAGRGPAQPRRRAARHAHRQEELPSFGIAVWWAIVTLATVGYGDVVRTRPGVSVVGSFVIVLGVTFLAFLTATVTSFSSRLSRTRRSGVSASTGCSRSRTSPRLFRGWRSASTAIEKKLEDRPSRARASLRGRRCAPRRRARAPLRARRTPLRLARRAAG